MTRPAFIHAGSFADSKDTDAMKDKFNYVIQFDRKHYDDLFADGYVCTRLRRPFIVYGFNDLAEATFCRLKYDGTVL